MACTNPILETYNGFQVVRDDFLPGGTKSRALQAIVKPGREYVYAGPAQGFAQVALAAVAGSNATVFVAKRKVFSPLTAIAIDLGAKVEQVPYGYLNVVQSRAKAYVAETGARLLPFGLDNEDCINAIAQAARSIPAPKEVWSVAGSGVLTRSLQKAWPGAQFNAVVVGKKDVDTGIAKRWEYPLAFDKKSKIKTPFPSVQTYDAKGWEFMVEHGSAGALFWNVAATP